MPWCVCLNSRMLNMPITVDTLTSAKAEKLPKQAMATFRVYTTLYEVLLRYHLACVVNDDVSYEQRGPIELSGETRNGNDLSVTTSFQKTPDDSWEFQMTALSTRPAPGMEPNDGMDWFVRRRDRRALPPPTVLGKLVVHYREQQTRRDGIVILSSGFLHRARTPSIGSFVTDLSKLVHTFYDRPIERLMEWHGDA